MCPTLFNNQTRLFNYSFYLRGYCTEYINMNTYFYRYHLPADARFYFNIKTLFILFKKQKNFPLHLSSTALVVVAVKYNEKNQPISHRWTLLLVLPHKPIWLLTFSTSFHIFLPPYVYAQFKISSFMLSAKMTLTFMMCCILFNVVNVTNEP